MNEFVANFHFIRPWAFVAAPVVILVWWYWQKSQAPLRGWREQMDPELLDALQTKDSGSGIRIHHFVLAIWLVMIIAIAGPTWRMEPTPFADDTKPLIVVLKADISMDRPFPPPSRIERAQLKVQDLAEMRDGQPLGLIVYADSAHLVLPPTRDTSIVGEMAREVDSSVMPKAGDRLDLALQRAGDLIEKADSRGSVLVIADSVTCDQAKLRDAHKQFGRFPIQFLSVTAEDSTDAATIRDAAKLLDAQVRYLSADEEDLDAITSTASRTAASIGGDSERWQEAGYWLTLLIAALVVASFRRESRVSQGARS